ncbi:hypothetical protein C8Q77DRAFT_736937 [Trametes polyzona]|nr:hypothetical protein C8Q77DRAFT_736937 [Trametes polyzona]
MTADAHPELRRLRDQLRAILDAMVDFGSAKLAAKPPILDSSISLDGEATEEFHSHQDAVHGLRALRDDVKRDLDGLEKFLENPASASMPAPSTNAPYLISVWNEVLHASPPIVTIWRTFSDAPQPASIPRRGSRKPPGVKVDVVADGGKRWMRVNTTKNSRLLAEFREIDSYMTGSEDESDEEERPSLAPKEFDNSILRAGRALLEAAQGNPLPGNGGAPSVTLRLTRLDPSPANPRDYDPRIAQTIQQLRDMGIEVELGERESTCLPQRSSASSRRLEPTHRVNLDLSLLIALVSDITHSPLPSSPAEADVRYVPSEQYREWKRQRSGSAKTSDEEADGSEPQRNGNGIGEHSRALANQALQEMARGLLHEIRDRLATACGSSDALEGVEFWTTPEARDRCLRIVLSKIGGPKEKQRAQALFASPDQPRAEAEAAYWEHSRYPRGFLPVVPIRVFESSTPPEDFSVTALPGGKRIFSPFFALLAKTCRNVLAQGTVPPPRLPPTHCPVKLRAVRGSDSADDVGSGDGSQLENGESEEIERAAVLKANPRLTEHTVQSMLWGAASGWTTLTANKSSVKTILREIRASEGGYGWFTEEEQSGLDGEEDGVITEAAAIWVVDPRSLAEGMRSDYQP